MSIASPCCERSTRMPIAGLFPTKYDLSRSIPLILTSATSDKSKDEPSEFSRSTILPMAVALRFSTPVRTRAFAPVTSPAGLVSTS